MTFEKLTDENMKVVVPAAALKLSGFMPGEALTLHTLEGVAVLLPKEMTAMDMVNAVEGLAEIEMGLIVALHEASGECKACEACDFDNLGSETSEKIQLPEDLLRKAGLEPDAKLLACVDEETGKICIEQAEYANNLDDISPETLILLAGSGLSLCRLEELLMMGDVIYGK